MPATNPNVETSRTHASTATTDGFAADGNAGAQKGGSFGNKAMAYMKEGVRQSEQFRQGVNSFADNAIQPSAARDADRGVSSQHRTGHTDHAHAAGLGNTATAEQVPKRYNEQGHEIIDGPARGTGTSGLGSHSGYGAGDRVGERLTGTGEHTGTTSAGGRAGFSSDAQALFGKAKQAWNDRNAPRETTATRTTTGTGGTGLNAISPSGASSTTTNPSAPGMAGTQGHAMGVHGSAPATHTTTGVPETQGNTTAMHDSAPGTHTTTGVPGTTGAHVAPTGTPSNTGPTSTTGPRY